MTNKINITIIQSDLVWENPSANRSVFAKKISEISQSTDIVVLPEMFTTGFLMQPQKLAETMIGDTLNWMKNIANDKEVAIIGSLIIKEEGNYYNRLVFVHPNGMVDKYDKRHLFTYGSEDKVYTAGNKRLIVNYKGWRICPMICYDVRFPVWSRNNDDYDLLIYTANWPKPRILAWDILLKARAIENMCYVIGVNRVGVDGNKLEYIGHSQVLDVLGNELILTEEKERIFEVTLNKKELLKMQSKFQFLKDKDSFIIEE